MEQLDAILGMGGGMTASQWDGSPRDGRTPPRRSSRGSQDATCAGDLVIVPVRA
jgi:hypothetical protein